MSCTSPLWYQQLRSDVKKGRVYRYLEKPSPVLDSITGEVFEPIQIPCGQCRSCRIAKSREWANRCVMEALDYNDGLCWFVTLTYDDDHIESLAVDNDYNLFTLNFDHMSEFIKTLRNKFRDCDLDYYYSPE